MVINCIAVALKSRFYIELFKFILVKLHPKQFFTYLIIFKTFVFLILFTLSNSLLSGSSDLQKSLADTPKDLLYQHFDDLYASINGAEKIPFDLFERGMIGYYQLNYSNRISGDYKILALVDFRSSSTEKRLWVIDLSSKQVLFNTFVSHGKNTGLEYANVFSNQRYSNSSSLGFYKMSETYYGRHGLSLKLDGLEAGFNDNARARGVVMHGAKYVSTDFVAEHGRLGRSFGCPAIPMECYQQVIALTEGSGVLFMYYPDEDYEAQTLLKNRAEALAYVIREQLLS